MNTNFLLKFECSVDAALTIIRFQELKFYLTESVRNLNIIKICKLLKVTTILLRHPGLEKKVTQAV